MTVAASPRARMRRSTLSESGPRLTRSPTNQRESRSAENFRTLSSAPSSVSQPCTSPIAYSAIRNPWTRLLVQHSGHGQSERRDGRVELFAVIRHHLVASLHGTDRGLDDCAGGIAKTLAGFEVRLLADHPIAARFLHVAVGVRNDPVAREQARRHLSLIADRDGAREDKPLVARIGLLLDIGRFDFDAYSGIHGF